MDKHLVRIYAKKCLQNFRWENIPPEGLGIDWRKILFVILEHILNV
jgi:hypothetical protein